MYGMSNKLKMNPRQQMKRSAQKPKRTGGGGGAYYANKYQPPLQGTDLIRIVPADCAEMLVDYDAQDFFRDDKGQPVSVPSAFLKYTYYYHGTKKRSAIGSEGPLGAFKGKGDPCIAADWYWWEWRQRQANGSKKPNAMSRGDRWAFSVIVLHPFFKVPSTDKDGNLRVNPATKEPYYEWVKGHRDERRNKEFEAEGYERKFGHRQHWSVGYGHYNTILDQVDECQRSCRSCGTQDSIRELAWVCGECGEAVIDMEETSLDEEGIAKLTMNECKCPHCGHVGYLEDVIECTACDHAERAQLYDYDFEVKRIANSDGGNQTTLNFVRAHGPRPIGKEVSEDLRKPLDLTAIFAPTPLDKQLEFFGPVPSDDDDSTVERNPVNRGTKSYGG